MLHLGAPWNAAPGTRALGINVTAFGNWPWYFRFTPAVVSPTLRPSPINDKYLALQGPTGILGPPAGDEAFCDDFHGQFRAYQNGAIYWSGTDGAGAFEVHGPILNWVLDGNPQSTLPSRGMGYPTRDIAPALSTGIGQ